MPTRKSFSQFKFVDHPRLLGLLIGTLLGHVLVRIWYGIITDGDVATRVGRVRQCVAVLAGSRGRRRAP